MVLESLEAPGKETTKTTFPQGGWEVGHQQVDVAVLRKPAQELKVIRLMVVIPTP